MERRTNSYSDSRPDFEPLMVDDSATLSQFDKYTPSKPRPSRFFSVICIAILALGVTFGLLWHFNDGEWKNKVSDTIQEWNPFSLQNSVELTLEKAALNGQVIIFSNGTKCKADLFEILTPARNLLQCLFWEEEPTWKDGCWTTFLSQVEVSTLNSVKQLPDGTDWIDFIPLAKQVDYNQLHHFGRGKSPRWRHGRFPNPCTIYVIGFAKEWTNDVEAWNSNCQIFHTKCSSALYRRGEVEWCPSNETTLSGITEENNHVLSQIHIVLTPDTLESLNYLGIEKLPDQLSIEIHLDKLESQDIQTALQTLHHHGYHAYVKQMSLDETNVLNLYLAKATSPWIAPHGRRKRHSRGSDWSKRSLSDDIDGILQKIAEGEIEVPGVQVLSNEGGQFPMTCSSFSIVQLMLARKTLAECLESVSKHCWSDFLTEVQHYVTSYALEARKSLPLPPSGHYTHAGQSIQYDWLTQSHYCDYNYFTRVGGEGDGGKWVCGEYLQHSDNCVIYSLGSNGDFSFETSMGAVMKDCEFHTFDCTGTWPVPKVDGKPVTTLHPWCLGEDHVDGDRIFMSFSNITKTLKHPDIAYLKMDIEGGEIPVFKEMLTPENLAHLPKQISFEAHIVHEGPAIVWPMLESVLSSGYRWAAKERNAIHPCCYEYVVIKE